MEGVKLYVRSWFDWTVAYARDDPYDFVSKCKLQYENDVKLRSLLAKRIVLFFSVYNITTVLSDQRGFGILSIKRDREGQ